MWVSLSSQIYYYADAQTTHTTYPDGVEVVQFPNKWTGECCHLCLRAQCLPVLEIVGWVSTMERRQQTFSLEIAEEKLGLPHTILVFFFFNEKSFCESHRAKLYPKSHF